jgi:hypothetical protein
VEGEVRMATSNQAPAPRILLSVEIEVTDEKVLRNFASDRYKKAWSNDLPMDMPLENVVMEAVVLSSDNPDPDEYGLQICETEAAVISEG